MEFILIFEVIFPFCNPMLNNLYGINPMPVWLVFVIAAAIYVLVFAFKAAGLYVMAQKREMKKLLWCAFVPFASTYLIGELSGGIRVGNTKIKQLGLITMVAEILYCAVVLMQNIPIAYAFTTGMYTVVEQTVGQGIYYTIEFSSEFPYALQKLSQVSEVLNYIFMVIYLIAEIFLLIAFYRVYAPVSYIWMVILGVVIGVANAFLIFAFRNRKPVDYDKFMAARAERYRRMQQSQYGPYGGPYNGPYNGNPYGYGGNPYGNPYNRPQGGQNAGGAPGDPFGEYPSDRDPFEEFSQKKDAGKDGENKDSEKDDRGGNPPDPFS